MQLRVFAILIMGFFFYPRNGEAQINLKDNLNYNKTDGAFTTNAPLNMISVKAFRHFSKNYPAVHDEQWTLTERELVVSFINDAKDYRIFYTKRGEFLLSVITYYQGKTYPEELKTLIRVGYPGCEIKNIVEL